MNHSTSYLFVINPVAGGKDKAPFYRLLKERAEKDGFPYDIMETTGADDEQRLRQKLDAFRPKRTAAVGGDGTAQLVGKVLKDYPSVALGIIPYGSANGLATELGISAGPEESLTTFLGSAQEWKLDLIIINDQYCCLHFADVGVNADLVKDFDRDRARGLFTYAKYLIRRQDFRIRVDDRPLERTGYMVALANERGFFRERLPAGETLDPGWHTCQYRFPDRDGWPASEFYVASEDKTGVISDIDDTVLISHSTKAIRKFFLILLRNAFTLDPFPFMKRWFEDLKAHNEGQPPADYFYVSDSEWNLYDFLVDFFQIHGIPKGVFLLKELRQGIPELLFGRSEEPTSKLERIRFLFDFYDRKPFILVEDSGQKDMEAYAQIVEDYPGRVKAVMIRDLPRIRDEEKIRQHRVVLKEKAVPFVTFSGDNGPLAAK